jgi:glyoxylase-like metal-dependent hydrolase (beta-lactamase superfamily II)
MIATSAAQFAASSGHGSGPTDVAVPPLERVTADTWVVALPLPDSGATTVPYTLCYLLLDATGAVHLVDPGFGSDENAARVRAALSELGEPRVASVVVTHLHPDHLGLADRIRTETGARIVLHEREQIALDAMVEGLGAADAPYAEWGVPVDEIPVVPPRVARGFVPLAGAADVLVADGDSLELPGRDIRVLLTPGHTPGHMCLRDERQGLLFTGDHVLPTVYPGLGLGGPTARSPIGEYLASLERIRAFDGDEVLPGHGYRFRGLGERIASIEAHHLTRSAEIAAVLAHTPDATVWDVAARVRWTAGWHNLHGFLRYSALAQTAMHVKYLAER